MTGTATKARQVATAVAATLADPGLVAARAGDPECVDHTAPGLPPIPLWQRSELSRGHPGLTLLFAELAATDPRHRTTARAHLASAAAGTVHSHGGLLGGVAGLAFAARRAAAGPRDFRRLLATADEGTRQATAVLVDELRRHQLGRSGTTIEGYDAVSGLSGLGAGLLDSPAADRAALHSVLEVMVALTEPMTAHGVVVPGWWLPGRPLVYGDGPRYAAGYFDVGLAHGIAGPLAVLALARIEGARCAGDTEAVERVATWLLRHRRTDRHGPYWPNHLSFAEEVGSGPDADERDRGGWCYGAPGVARSLWLAGVALGRPEWTAVAVEAVRATVRRASLVSEHADAGLCHGLAGLLHIAGLMAADSGDAELASAADGFAGRLVTQYRPDAPFGFRCRRPDQAPDRPGFLDGSAGIALALLAYADGGTRTGWDRALLLR